jgi:hypothetical protein
MRGRVPSRRTGPRTRPRTSAQTPQARRQRAGNRGRPLPFRAAKAELSGMGYEGRTSRKRRTPTAKTAGVRRRVIEGEGLGGFARRISSIPVLPGGSCALHIFFRRRAGGAGLPAAALAARGMHAHDPELAQIGGRNIDPLPARQHDIARKHPQMPIFPAAPFDNISGADRKTFGQRTGLAVNWQTHGTLFVCVGNFQKFEHQATPGSSAISLTTA